MVYNTPGKQGHEPSIKRQYGEVGTTYEFQLKHMWLYVYKNNRHLGKVCLHDIEKILDIAEVLEDHQ